MGVIKPLTKIVVIGGIAVMAYSAIFGGGPFKKTPAPVEQGYENPAYVKLHTQVNEAGNKEFYLIYDNGKNKLSLPVLAGPKGPLVGDSDYYWSSIGQGTKTGLIAGSWDELEISTKKTIMRGELEKMIENYGLAENGNR